MEAWTDRQGTTVDFHRKKKKKWVIYYLFFIAQIIQISTSVYYWFFSGFIRISLNHHDNITCSFVKTDINRKYDR
jgi:hypothetical protein